MSVRHTVCLSVSIKRCLILDLKIGVSFVYATLPCMKFHIRDFGEKKKKKTRSLYQALSAPMSFQHCCFSLPHPALRLPGPAWWNANSLWSGLHYQWLWCSPVWGFWLRETAPQRTEKSPGIPPALMRSIPVRRSPQAASTRWNARPLSLAALLRAISNSLREWLASCIN